MGTHSHWQISKKERYERRKQALEDAGVPKRYWNVVV